MKDQKVKIPDFPKGSVDIKRLVLSDELVNVYLDEKGVEHKRPAYVFGRFFLEMVEGDGNCVAGTRIDTQGAIFQESEEERASFSSSIDSLDISKSIVSFSKPMIFNNRDPEKQNRYTFGPATELFWVTAVEVRDEKTWQPYRLEYLKKLGDGTDESVCLIVIKDDIQPWTVGKYDANGVFVSSTNNKDEVQKQCQYYADAIAATFETVATTRKTFMGLYPVDMDGRICQVSYRISKQGSDTVVSTGTEHDFDIPSYDERCQRWARKNGDRKLQYMESKQKRLDRLKGTSFTI